MKKSFILAGIIILCSVQFIQAQNNLAKVNRINGFYIFMDCQPQAEYEALGEIKADESDPDIRNSSSQYQSVRDNLIKVARSTYYTANGLILTLVNGGTDKATAIKFKEGMENVDYALVQQYQGVYIFIDCTPVKQTTYIGTVSAKRSPKGPQYTPVRDNLIKIGKKKFKTAQAFILKLVVGAADTGDAISF
jgi:hypothetical protein